MKATSRLLAIVIPIFLVMTSGCSSDASGDAPAGQNVEPASAQNGSPAATADQSVAEPENGADTGSLAGTSWRLVEIKSMDDSVYAPENPDHYTLTFGSNSMIEPSAMVARNR